ncbi:MAG: CoB--CoM heterodisulfide reductase iron-sulfur subunit A family protein [Clostridiales bacterium]|nr:CoB--CoM heterodisulfide reductase iron-sulfur subunit A family protein [Clostridiales bacterium]MBP3940947.1 CoB--CoM heterodisulfide reductase iron-sulfur subunit A family protein [Christensenellaceae bacterium]MBR2223551.1 CoB--CoM heterodisulfide reductase iron-sulfur subunit A family protein [Christensenellaceae bacterium]MBR3842494.1 CoB--CoM heterodisulfide reductase iron-sulfur subunit A family protein [Christensenellaceae bacterium]
MQKIGVFVCWCGSNIAGTVDVKAVAEAVKSESGVVYSTDYQYMCSAAGQKLISDAIAEKQLDGIVVCSCSPRMHEATFRRTAENAGLNPYMVEIANIREQCSWIHKDMEEGTEKAIILAKAAIAKVRNNTPLQAGTSAVTKRALVIGGGIAGIQTALDVADAGFEVDIVEQGPTIGGRMAQLDKTFPTLDCAACILTPKMVDAAQSDKINIISYANVEKVSGFVGNFKATIRKKARFVDEAKCTGCGECMAKCPSKKGKDEFNMKLNNRPAIYIPFAQAIPNVAVIDTEQCIKMKTGKCGLCQKVCSAGAINYEQKDEFIEREYGAIVVATGFRQMDPSALNEFGYAENKDVVTSLEFERLMNAAGPTKGTLLRPSDGSHPKTLVFIQCVGSRCDENTDRGKPYCSKICCMYTAKHAMLVREKYPDTDVHVFYIDERTPGKNFDEFYRRAAEQYGVDYIKGMVGKVAQENGKLMVQGSDLINNEQVKIEADMVVLAAAIEPDPTARSIATMLTASMDTNDFFTEAHPKLRPVESPTAGIFLSGVAQGPKDIPETVAQAGAAASKVISLLVKDHLVTNPCIAESNALLCNGCSQCEKVCPYGAITYVDKEVRGPGVREVRRVAQVNPAVCQGCGACTVTCPSGAMDLKGFSNKQIMSEVDAICL